MSRNKTTYTLSTTGTQIRNYPDTAAMDIELTDHPTLAEKNPAATSQRRFIKDEAILARFGKRQQLRVGAPTCASVMASLASECLNWKADYADSVLQRGFGLLPVIGLTSTLMITWEAITASVLILNLVLSSRS